MRITFYNCSDPTIKLDKNNKNQVGITNAKPQPTGPVDVVNPILIVDKDNVPANANYCYIHEYERFYFITSIDWTTANTAVVGCHCDVLSTFSDKIKGTKFNFVRGASDVNEIEDTSYPLGDRISTPVNAYYFAGWANNNFSKNDSGTRYVLRTVAAKARNETVHTMAIGDYFRYLGRYVYQIIGSENSQAECMFVNESTSGDYEGVKRQDIIKIGDYKYKFMVGSDYPTAGRLDPLF